MSVPPELTSLGSFCLLVGIYLIPCLVGSTVSYFVKNKITTKDLKAKKMGNVILKIMISSLMPAIAISILDITLEDKIDKRIILGISAIVGAAGEDITQFIISMKGLITAIKFLSKGPKNLSSLAELSDRLEEYNNHRDEDNNDESE